MCPMNPRLMRPLARRQAPAPTDPFFSSVSLLLHFDGANGSTTFTDSSSNALTVTPYGDAAISTAQSKFGGASAYFDQDGDYAVVIPSSPATDFGTGDFTVEFWVRVTSTTGIQVIWSRWNNSGDNKIQIYLVGDSLYLNSPTTGYLAGTLTQEQWHHIAVCRDAGDMAVYVDGVQEWAAAVGDDFTSTSDFVLGANDLGSGGANWFGGYIDDFRITKGVARYTANFTPPTAAFPNQ